LEKLSTSQAVAAFVRQTQQIAHQQKQLTKQFQSAPETPKNNFSWPIVVITLGSTAIVSLIIYSLKRRK